MRWRFADPTNTEEMAFRSDMLERFDTFWKVFAENVKLFDAANIRSAATLISDALAKVDERLMWEMTPARDADAEFVITPESDAELLPMVETMLERAPAIPGFKFFPFKQPVDASQIVQLVDSRVGSWIPDVRFRAELSDHNDIELRFASEGFRGTDRIKDLEYCMVVMEDLLGQEVLDVWIGKVMTESTKPGVLAQMGVMFGRSAPSVSTDGMADVKDIVRRTNELKSACTARLPVSPLWHIDAKALEESGVALIKVTGSDAAGRITITTTMKNIAMGFLASPGRFSSVRFSRFGELFCFIKTQRPDGVAADPTGHRSKLEAFIDESLRGAGVGCVIGSGSGAEFDFFDVAIADIDKAIPTLRQSAIELKLPAQTWLRFLDAKFRSEWVGLHESSPQPDLSKLW